MTYPLDPCPDCMDSRMLAPEFKAEGKRYCEVHWIERERHRKREHKRRSRALAAGKPPPEPDPYVPLPLDIIPGAYFSPSQVQRAHAAMVNLLEMEDFLRVTLDESDLARVTHAAQALLQAGTRFRSELWPLLNAANGTGPRQRRLRRDQKELPAGP